ncbi:integral membrane protein [Lactiplantibacillus plantarum]|nr:integral membrane protein [Lactiplantibacillus plantarum]
MKVKITKRQLISGAVLLALLLIGLLIYRYHGTWEIIQHRVFDQSALVAQVRRQRAIDILLVVPLLICFSIIPGAPVATISVVAGICFGKGLGAVLNIIGITLGNLIAQRFFGRVTARRDQQPSKLVTAIGKMRHPLLGIVIGYTIPFIPTSLVSLAAIETAVTPRQLAAATLLGSMPTAIIYAWGCDELIKAHFKNALMLVGLLVLLLGLLWLIHHDRQRAVDLDH